MMIKQQAARRFCLEVGNKEVTITPSGSAASLQVVARGQRGMSREYTVESTFGGDEDEPISEKANPLSASRSNPTGFQYASPLQHNELDKDLGFSSETLSEIQGYFGSRYERMMRGYLKEIDDLADEFAEMLLAEQKKVVQFYDDKVGELEKRLSLWIESVASSTMFRRTSSTDEEDITRTAAKLDARSSSNIDLLATVWCRIASYPGSNHPAAEPLNS